MNKTSVESWLQDGCGRCALFATPACKVLLWTDALLALRALVRETELSEEMKWGSPCYTLDGKNIVTLTALKDFCALGFFQGAALPDPDGILVSPGPNSRFARYLTFRSVAEVERFREPARALLQEAILLARSGKRFTPDTQPELLPHELLRRLEADPALAEAFSLLTPGRRRSHTIHISGAISPAARERRVERCVPKIMAGLGFHER